MLASAERHERRYPMAQLHETIHACPICSGVTLRRVRCSHAACSFFITTCARCDRPHAVAAFVADHEKDCVHGASWTVVARPALFVSPRKAA